MKRTKSEKESNLKRLFIHIKRKIQHNPWYTTWKSIFRKTKNMKNWFKRWE